MKCDSCGRILLKKENVCPYCGRVYGTSHKTQLLVVILAVGGALLAWLLYTGA